MDDEFINDDVPIVEESEETAEPDAEEANAKCAPDTEEGADDASAVQVTPVEDEPLILFSNVPNFGVIRESVSVKPERGEDGELVSDDEEEPIYLGEKRNEKTARERRRQQQAMKEEMMEEAARREIKEETEMKPQTTFDLVRRRGESNGSRDHTPPPRIPNFTHVPELFALSSWETVQELAARREAARQAGRRRADRNRHRGARSMVGGSHRRDDRSSRERARSSSRRSMRDALTSMDGRRSRSRSPHPTLAYREYYDGRTRDRRGMVDRDNRSSRREERETLHITTRGNDDAASVVAGSVVAGVGREIQVVRVKKEAGGGVAMIKREKKEEPDDDDVWGRRRPPRPPPPSRSFSRRSPSPRRTSPRSARTPMNPRPSSRSGRRTPPRSSSRDSRRDSRSPRSRSFSRSPSRRPPSPVGSDVEVVKESIRSRRSLSRSSHFGDNTPFENLVANVNKRLGGPDDPVGFDSFNPKTTSKDEPCRIVVHSDEENARFGLVMLDPTYGMYPLEAVRVIRDEAATKTYEFEFTPIMYGPHVIILTHESKFFLVHSVRVRGTNPPPQRRPDQNRPRLPRLDVQGVDRDVATLFHAPRPRRNDEKHVDVRQVLEGLLRY
ncbi:hypothetical protein PENTCL1PPCAC_10372 [Pristionchus entomophagus]|uniref:Uncharacterized protein n=1 Tax=Pristionchus entomophagus TaxID=358040 RepID=A0AAV5SY15_9BILA|nr:hypothetical protein PENTCL1PPCAC_10372 [Pristionchus entomophagus]